MGGHAGLSARRRDLSRFRLGIGLEYRPERTWWLGTTLGGIVPQEFDDFNAVYPVEADGLVPFVSVGGGFGF